MHLSALFIHPVKALRGCSVDRLEIDALGPVGDRRFLVVDADGRFMTQRAHPRMALIATELGPDALRLSAAGRTDLAVARAPDPAAPLRSVSIWKSEGLLAEDCGGAAADWLGDCLGLRCRLVRIGPAFNRPVKPGRSLPGDQVGFADAYPFLALAESSLDGLNDRLAAQGLDPAPLNRFRPNVLISGCPAHAEDTWKRIRIGTIVLRAAGPCARCVVTTTDQADATRGPEPLRTLAAYRRDPVEPGQVNFGQNLIHETKSGLLSVGDAVEVLDP